MIQSVVLKNFKSIKEASTTLPPFVGAIVGVNGVGKTNFIQGINFVRSLVTGMDTSDALKKIALTPQELLNYNESSQDIFFGITVNDLNENRYLFELTLTLSNDANNIHTFLVKTEKLYKVFEPNRMEIVYTRESSLFHDINNNSIPLAVENDRVALSIYQNTDVLLVKNIFSNIFIPDQDSIDFRESIVRSDEKGLAGSIIRLSNKDQTSYQHFLKIIKHLLPTFSTIVQSTTPQVDPATAESEKPYMVLLEEENLKGKLSMKSLSAGDLRTLYIVASVMSLQPGSTFIIEETENGLHPKRLTDLLDHLDQIAYKKDLQIIYSTHSPIVINRLGPEKVVFVDKDTAEGTKLHLLKDSKHIDNIKNLLNEGLSMTDILYSRI